eukprot:scaffold1384_cov140-Skeletonema_menzelii.AAC.7
MVTAIFGKPLPRASASSATKEKEDGKIREQESERATTATAAPATAREKLFSSNSNNNDDSQKLSAHSQRWQNFNNNNGFQYDGGFSAATITAKTSTQESKILPATTTTIPPREKIQNGEIVTLMPNKSASRRPLKHDKTIGSMNSNGEKNPKNPISAHPAATKAVVATCNTSKGEEKWIKTFNDLKEYQYQHGRLPMDNGKSVEEVDLKKWMDLQSYLHEKHLEGWKSPLSKSRIDLLRSVGMLDDAVSKVESKRMCTFGGCKRSVGEYDSLHCTEHSNGNVYIYTPNPLGDSTSIDTYNTSKPAVKRAKTNSKGMPSKSSSNSSSNGSKYSLKSPPEETVMNGSHPEDTSNVEGDDAAKMVKLAADAVAKELRYLVLQSQTDHVESSIKRYAIEVYYPLLYSSKERERSMGTSSYSASRVLLSTLLALQEMLIINAEKFFSFEGLKDSFAEKESDAEANSKLTHDFARAVIQNAAKRLQRMTSDVIPNQACLFDEYLETSRRYDARGEDFQLALGRLDASATYRNAKGSKLGERESIMARTSFNFAREQHPLIREDDQPAAHPAPNACAIFVTGKSESEKKEDTSQTSLNIESRHRQRTEARESRIRSLKRYYDRL